MTGGIVKESSVLMSTSFGRSLFILTTLSMMLIQKVREICCFQPFEYQQFLFYFVVEVQTQLRVPLLKGVDFIFASLNESKSTSISS